MHLCQYKVVVSTSQVCDSPYFADVGRGGSDIADDPLGSNAEGEEDWFMRISTVLLHTLPICKQRLRTGGFPDLGRSHDVRGVLHTSAACQYEAQLPSLLS